MKRLASFVDGEERNEARGPFCREPEVKNQLLEVAADFEQEAARIEGQGTFEDGYRDGWLSVSEPRHCLTILQHRQRMSRAPTKMAFCTVAAMRLSDSHSTIRLFTNPSDRTSRGSRASSGSL